MKPATRSRSGQPRDLDGRFIKGGSKVKEAAPVQAKMQEAVADQVGSRVEAAVSGRIHQVQAVAVQEADVDLEQQFSSDGNEVSSHESEGCDSSSANSDFDNEEDEELEETGNQNAVLFTADGGLLADQVFDQMPQSCPSVPGVQQGAVGFVKAQEGGDGAAKVAPWVKLFKDNRNLGMGIKLDEWEVDGDLVMLEEDDVDVVEEVWGYCMVGLFAGKFPGMAAVRNLKEGWKVNCSHWRHRSGWFVFKFQSEEDRRKVLNGGPYFAYGSNLILKTMPRCFRFEGEDVSSVPIWIQLPGLPLDCWNARALGKIVSKVGKPLTTDKMTLTKERLSFARVLVEVDASTDIVSDVEVRLPTGVVYHQSVIAEFTPKFCKRCKSFGHVEGTCGKGSEGGQPTPFVAKKKTLSAGVGLSAPSAPVSIPIATPVVEVRVDGGAGLAGEGTALAATGVKPTRAVLDNTAFVTKGKIQTGGGSVSSKSVYKEGGGPPLDGDPNLGEATAAGSEDLGPLAGKQTVGEASTGCSNLPKDGLAPAGPGLAAEPDAPICPVEGPVSSVLGGVSSGQKGKQKIKSGQQLGAAALHPSGVETVAVEGHVSSVEEGSSQGRLGAGLPLTSPLGPVEDLDTGDVGWTNAGKKGKKKKEAGQPGVDAVQHQPDGEGLQGGYPGGRVRFGEPDPDRFLYPYIPRWKGKGKGRQSFDGRGGRR